MSDSVDRAFAATGAINSPDDFLLASSPCIGVDGRQEFGGRMDDIRVYSRALSDYEVAALYQATAPAGGGGGGDCTAPVSSEGTMIYNTDNKVMQFCNGTEWVPIGKFFP